MYLRYTDYTYGSWMRDPASVPNEKEHEKFWVTYENQSNVLFEYDNKTMFRSDARSSSSSSSSYWLMFVVSLCFFFILIEVKFDYTK